MKLAPNLKKPVLTVHESTLPSLSDVEKMFLDQFVQQGRAVIVPDASQGVM